MRIGPLILFDNAYPAISDCLLSNFNQVNIGCSVVFYYTIRYMWLGYSLKDIYSNIRKLSTEELVVKAVDDAFRGVDRTISGPDKGHVVNTLWAALYCLFQNLSYPDALFFLARHEGDVDTNMCVTGYLLGARDGEVKLRMDPVTNSNLNIMLNAAGPTGYPVTGYPRRPEYTLYNYNNKLLALQALLHSPP